MKIGKRKYQGKLTQKQVQSLLGYIGLLNDEELQTLLFEVLDPIDCNYVMSDKQIDEHVEILSAIIAKSLNDLRYKS